MAIPIENVWHASQSNEGDIFSSHPSCSVGYHRVPLGHKCYCHGANALMIDAQHKEFKMKDIVPVACKMLAWNLTAAI